MSNQAMGYPPGRQFAAIRLVSRTPQLRRRFRARVRGEVLRPVIRRPRREGRFCKQHTLQPGLSPGQNGALAPESRSPEGLFLVYPESSRAWTESPSYRTEIKASIFQAGVLSPK